MNDVFTKQLSKLIKNTYSEDDYISGVKYVIFFISEIILTCKVHGFDILDHTMDFVMKKFSHINENTAVFNDFKYLSKDDIIFEKKVFSILCQNKDKLYSEDFIPAKLYEVLLTPKEKKLLGQVYTPNNIILKMLNNVLKIKEPHNTIKILDPSCGGGYFLIEAYKIIKSKYYPDSDDKYIIENMLYGFDIDDFSIFLTKLGLMFISNNIDINFKIFNIDFLINKHNIKFDIIIGNPPYIGHKNTNKEYKLFLKEKYCEVFYDKADISYCFFKRSKDCLKTDGILSFITSRYFMEALYADKLRNFLKKSFDIISLEDYNGIRVFKDAMVSPSIITLSNTAVNKNKFIYIKHNRNISKTQRFEYEQNKLKSNGWIILESREESLFNRINNMSNFKINEICEIKQGIITGLDKAFIIDENIIEKYKIEKFLLKKWIKNSNITKSHIAYNYMYLLYMNMINDEKECPNAIKYLKQYKSKLADRRECKNGYRKWYELQWGRNTNDFEKTKILFPYKAKFNNFYMDKNKYYCSADVYMINNIHDIITPEYLQDYLNSGIFEFYFKCMAKKVGEDLYEYYPNKLKECGIYIPSIQTQKNISVLKKISIENFLEKVFNITQEEVKIIINKYISQEGDDAN